MLLLNQAVSKGELRKIGRINAYIMARSTKPPPGKARKKKNYLTLYI